MRSIFLPVLAGCVTAQFSSPSKASALELGKQIDIKWNTAGLEAPIAINLVPAGVAGRTVIAQQVAGLSPEPFEMISTNDDTVGIQNIGLLTWAPDLSIAAFPSFNMVIIDSKARVVVSEEFTIQSLVQQPAIVTRLIPVVTDLVATNSMGVVTKQRVTSMSKMLLPLPTEPIKLHMSGTQVVDAMVTGVNEQVPKPTQDVNKDGQKEGLLPLPGVEGEEKPVGELKPLPSASDSTTTSSAEPSQTEAKKEGGNGDSAAAGKKNQGSNKNMQGKQKGGNGSKNRDKQLNSGKTGASAKSGGGKDGNKNNNKGKTQGSKAKKPMAKRSPEDDQLQALDHEDIVRTPTLA
ncbi:hypothetical protein MAC_05271 [Metarhizium acridum CQMa 102]|uniref:Uncharacterized protein n=1 Tax=Metarhizium acridum (strain CQMa 102) TaxID=655827 RepID=E9E5X3_METAQ|nr:uncharacterized protein MAC_05271 [Metarhizium acridum CQMa 102]EFY88653.1 hypothetical protein MAC_05271 [Metarhizium acridum CQMa 102]